MVRGKRLSSSTLNSRPLSAASWSSVRLRVTGQIAWADPDTVIGLRPDTVIVATNWIDEYQAIVALADGGIDAPVELGHVAHAGDPRRHLEGHGDPRRLQRARRRDGAEFRLGPGGAKWMQAAGLATGRVDNKVLSLGDEIGGFAGKQMISDWRDSKDGTLEGQIVSLADLLCVVSYCAEEHALGNRRISFVLKAAYETVLMRYHTHSYLSRYVDELFPNRRWNDPYTLLTREI